VEYSAAAGQGLAKWEEGKGQLERSGRGGRGDGIAGWPKKPWPAPTKRRAGSGGEVPPGDYTEGGSGQRTQARMFRNSASKAILAIGWYTAERLQREEDEGGMRAWSGEKQRPPNEREGRHSQGPNASRPTPLLRPVRHVNVPGPECRGPATGERGVIANGCKGRAGEAPKGPRERDTDGAGQQKAGLVANHQSNKKGAKEQAGAGAARMGVGLDAEKNAGFKG